MSLHDGGGEVSQVTGGNEEYPWEKAVELLLVGLLMVGWFAFMGVRLLHDHEKVADYSRAVACSAPDDPVDGTGDCLLTVSGTVDAVVRHSQISQESSGPWYSMDVTIDAEKYTIVFPADSAMLAHAVPGGQADVTVWRTDPVTIADASGSADTLGQPSIPVGRHVEQLALGEGIAILALCGLGKPAYAKHAEKRVCGPSYFVLFGLPALGAELIGVYISGVQIGVSFRVVAVLSLLVLIGCTALTVNRRLRLRFRSA
jgi:uncharacterized membrane protein